MYPNYLGDQDAQDIDTCMRAVEGDQSHLRIQRGSVTLSLTANTQLNTNVSFSPIFTPSTTVDVYLTPTSVGSISASLNLIASSASNTGFTLQAYSSATQQVTVNWLAIGKAE